MCGIFGIISSNKEIVKRDLRSDVKSLFLLSESRGKEAAGIGYAYKDVISVLKDAKPSSEMIKSELYKSLWSGNENDAIMERVAIIGHSRLVTDGTEELCFNNQPVIKNGFLVVHNGIITNVGKLFGDNPDLKREYEVDTEIIPSLLNKYLDNSDDILDAVRKIYKTIEGSASIAVLSDIYDITLLATNNGSLYYVYDEANKTFVFTSERYIMSKYLNTSKLKLKGQILQLKSDETIIIDNSCAIPSLFRFGEIGNRYKVSKGNKKSIKILDGRETIRTYEGSHVNLIRENITEDNTAEVEKLRRCSRCLLPETFPFISFDDKGVCIYCRNYKKKFPEKKDGFERNLERMDEFVGRYRSGTGEYDVLVPFSGGRDSSYGLHYIKNELKLNPVTYTYDWGMITDLARRNISRICGKLGVENILVSADIRKKRRYIRKNVEAWLKKPELGVIPLFMAGDKQFFYYMNKLKKETNIRLNIWMTNPLENTDFKSGFAGISPDFDKGKIDDITFSGKIRLLKYYLGNFIINPSYLNSSIFDTAQAFISYYIEERKDYLLLFDYLDWNEVAIEDFLINEYNWELSPDSKSSWRIGDGTAAFYNYIYYTVCGFTENDTFRSNQIREGKIDRAAALSKIYEENLPRELSLKWYCSTIGIDYESTIKTINAISKLYRK